VLLYKVADQTLSHQSPVIIVTLSILPFSIRNVGHLINVPKTTFITLK